MGKYILSGQHHQATDWEGKYLTNEARHIKKLCGDWPAVWGADFKYGPSSSSGLRRLTIDTAKVMHARGCIIAMTYHQAKPTCSEGNAKFEGDVKGWMPDADWERLLTPGSSLQNSYLQRLDNVAVLLKELQDEGIPVLWRPYHEIQCGFWWDQSKDDRTKRLWRLMFDRYVNHHKLRNLIWNWNFNYTNKWCEDPEGHFPGIDYVDMVTVDDYHWVKSQFLKKEDYDIYERLSGGKPGGISEWLDQDVPFPDPEWLVKERPGYTFFYTWDSDFLRDHDDQIPWMFQHEKVLTAGEFDYMEDVPQVGIDSDRNAPEQSFNRGTISKIGSGRLSVSAPSAQTPVYFIFDYAGRECIDRQRGAQGGYLIRIRDKKRTYITRTVLYR
jgi:mannan endo-1,4-beta-mannosidase